jgi:hypothetical protein
VRTEFVRKIFSLFEAAVHRQISPFEFELAYQARVAMERIRFAIKVTEQSANQPEQLHEVCFQLLDALNRLDAAERSFQRRCQSSYQRPGSSNSPRQSLNGSVGGLESRKGAPSA